MDSLEMKYAQEAAAGICTTPLKLAILACDDQYRLSIWPRVHISVTFDDPDTPIV